MKTATYDAISRACGDDRRDEVEALLEYLARERVGNDPLLSHDTEIIFGDWPNRSEHLPWLLTATSVRIGDWVESVRT